MNLLWGFLVTAGVAALAISAMLLVRRRAPEGSYFKDEPLAVERALRIDGALAAIGGDLRIPCNAEGNAA